jgi:hypothetical protein
MIHCKAGEKVVVKYKFPEKEEIRYTTKNAPIEITVQPITAKYYVFTGYVCEYWIDAYDQETGVLENSQRSVDTGSNINPTLISPDARTIYPPFEYPITEWLDLTGFSSYCRHQYYRQGVRFSNSAGQRRISYFNFLGAAERPSRQSSNCYPPYVPRDVTFRRLDGKEDPLKWEIHIVDSKQNSFTDYGLQKPTYAVQCGDCPEDSIRCHSNHYPGYNCIPCSEMKSEIAAIRSMIRRRNG